MSNLIKWLKCLWNIRLTLSDHSLVMTKVLEEMGRLQLQLDDLRQFKIDTERKSKKLQESKTTPIEVVEDRPKNIRVNKYYDPQMNVEYVDIEINGEKASPNDDTVAEE